MILDTNNNTAENGTNHPEADETPQSILEKRLAEINARKAEQEDTIPTDEAINTPVPVSETSENEIQQALPIPGTQLMEAHLTSSESSTATPPGEPVNTGVSAPLISNQLISEAAATDVVDAAATIPTDLTTHEGGTNANNFSFTKAQPETPQTATNQLAASPPDELLSTAGIITEISDSSEQVAAANPEAATTTQTNEETGADHDSLADEEAHDDLIQENDYSTLPLAELRKNLLNALKSATRKNARQIYDMYRQYEVKFTAEREEALHQFLEEGNVADDFQFNPGQEHLQLVQAFQQFRENRNRDQRQEEEQRVKNTRRKQELLEQLRDLVETPETRTSTDKIKNIQAEWKMIGAVTASESQQLWSSYHALLDIFYNNRSIFYELKELDRRKNLQLKVQLCERAEALIGSSSINNALQELRHLHEEWKNVGPVPNEHRDSIWERFIQASEKIHARKKDFISERKTKEQENLSKKSELLLRIDAFQNYHTDRINDWRDKTEEIQKIKQEWDAIGLVPKEKADEINRHFWSCYKAFFNHKNAFFKAMDEQKMQNMRLKVELCEQAERLKDSEDWEETKEKLIQLQKQWKTVGRVPDKYSDKLWNRFRTACNEFFDRKQNQVQQREAEQNRIAGEKSTFYEKVASRVTTLNKQPGSLEELASFRTSWEAFEAKGSQKLDDRFYDLLQKYVDTIPTLSNEEKNNLAVELQVTHLRKSPDAAHRIYQKEQSIRKEIAQLENDIRTLKTNIEFFGRSRNADKLREEYQVRIDEADKRIQMLQRQLYAFRNL